MATLKSDSNRSEPRSLNLTPTRSGFVIYWQASEARAMCVESVLPVDTVALEIPLHTAGTRVCIWHWGRTIIAHEPREGLHLVLHGDLFSPKVTTPADLITGIVPDFRANGGEIMARSLRGSFVLIVVDSVEGRVVVVTDRAGTRKVFQTRQLGDIWLGSSVECLPDKHPDPAGVVSMMLNNFCFVGRTLLANVSLLERASIYELNRHSLTRTCYWEPRYGEGISASGVSNLESAYAELMRQAVNRMLPEKGRIFMSLSGGIDSRAVFGLLVSDPTVRERLTAFSYGEEDEDVTVAKKLCAYTGIPHLVLRYQGDLAETIRRNGLLSQGLVSFYTHGLDGLFALEQDFRHGSVMFVGDIAFRQGTRSFATFDEMLTYGVGIHSPIVVPSWYGYGMSRPSDIEDQLNSDAASLKERVRHYENLSDANQFLLLDQRQNYQILPWREFFTGRFLPVANPLIDEDILEFAATVPSKLTYDKLLHRNTIKIMFQKLCEFPFAVSGISNNRAFGDFTAQKWAINQLIEPYDSRLDDLVPPDVIRAALAEFVETSTLDRHQLPRMIRKIIDKARWRYGSKVLRHNLAKNRSQSNASLSWDGGLPKLGPRQLGQLLSIRYFLRK